MLRELRRRDESDLLTNALCRVTAPTGWNALDDQSKKMARMANENYGA